MLFLKKVYRMGLCFLWLPVIGTVAVWYNLFGGSYWEKVKKLSFCSSRWAAVILKLIKFQTIVYGDPKEADGVLLVSNHCGYLDILTEGATFPIRFAPKSDIRKWPFLGWYLGLSCPIWVNRESKQQSFEVMKACRETLKNGTNMLIYPEGTSSDGEHGILPFKSTAFEAVCGENIPILPIVIIYHPTPDGFPLPWFGDAELMPHFWHMVGYRRCVNEIHILPKIYPEGRDRKELARYVHDLMEAKYSEIKKRIQETGSGAAPSTTKEDCNGQKNL